MCGIAGIVVNDSRKYRTHIAKALGILRHRGPDDEGIQSFNQCILGHRRLSIVDLNLGHQPLLNPNGKVAITFNGEIYGYQAIKNTLSDYPFQTTSDTEVIIALYAKYRESLLDKLPGMFSFAIWDDREQQLFCARDRFGEKPFYYAYGKNGEFIFASEIKAILETDLVQPVLNPSALGHYIQHLYVHPSQTIYKNIYTLPPGHALVYKHGRFRTFRYWKYPNTYRDIELHDAVAMFRKLLEQAVEKQLIADVPVAAFLSGGLDSSTIVALASQYKPHIKTFTLGFGSRKDELPFASAIARKYHTDHTELVVKEDIASLLQKMTTIFDEPFADSSAIPTYLISKYTRKYTKVALTGDGGDELLGGYGWYKTLVAMKDNSISHTFHAAFFRMLSGILFASTKQRFFHKHFAGLVYRKKFRSVLEAHATHNTYFTDSELARLQFPKFKAISHRPSWKLTNTINDALRMDAENYMPGDILVKTDRTSMSNGLELRAPFLDMDFASFCLSLPGELKVTTQTDKIILREAFSHLWTPDIRRRKKHGFGAPVNEWLTYTSVQLLVKKYLKNPNNRLFSVIDYDESALYIDTNTYQTWILLVLSLWMETHPFNN